MNPGSGGAEIAVSRDHTIALHLYERAKLHKKKKNLVGSGRLGFKPKSDIGVYSAQDVLETT